MESENRKHLMKAIFENPYEILQIQMCNVTMKVN